MSTLPIESKTPTRISLTALIAANLIPIFGVIYLGWDVFAIMLLFWVENVVVGLLNAVRMLVCQPSDVPMWLAKIFMIPFFCVHYGMFTAVHGLFVVTLFGPDKEASMDMPDLLRLPELVPHTEFWIAVAALAASHLISFFVNYIGRDEYKTTGLHALMFRPYGRVVILHVTIIFGGFAVMALGSPVWALVMLVALKTTGDVFAHKIRHKSDEQAAVQQSKMDLALKQLTERFKR